MDRGHGPWDNGPTTAKPAEPDYDSDDSEHDHYDLAWQVTVAIAGVLVFACIIGCIVWAVITFCADRRKTRTVTTAPTQQPKRPRVAETRTKKRTVSQAPAPPKPAEPARQPNDTPFLNLMSPPTPMPKSPKLPSSGKLWNYAQQPSQKSSVAPASTLSEHAIERTCTEYTTLE